MTEIPLHRTTAEERRAFLGAPHIGIMSITDANRPPQASPVWYLLTADDTIEIHISPSSRKAALLEAAGEFSLCVQNDKPPYGYVTVNGPITSQRPVDPEADSRPMQHRYLGQEMGDRVMDSQGPSDAIVITMTPERWYGLDYKKTYGHLLDEEQQT